MKKIKIDTEYIKLDQLLKFSELVSSGGEAKLLIENGCITLNDELVFERGKKIRIGDVIKVVSKSNGIDDLIEII
jgi:ribosome-associated protein